MDYVLKMEKYKKMKQELKQATKHVLKKVRFSRTNLTQSQSSSNNSKHLKSNLTSKADKMVSLQLFDASSKENANTSNTIHQNPLLQHQQSSKSKRKN